MVLSIDLRGIEQSYSIPAALLKQDIRIKFHPSLKKASAHSAAEDRLAMDATSAACPYPSIVSC